MDDNMMNLNKMFVDQEQQKRQKLIVLAEEIRDAYQEGADAYSEFAKLLEKGIPPTLDQNNKLIAKVASANARILTWAKQCKNL